MPVRTHLAVILADSDDASTVKVEMRDEATDDRVVYFDSGTVFVSLFEVESFANRLLEFVAYQRTAECSICGQKFGPGDPLCGCDVDTEDGDE